MEKKTSKEGYVPWKFIMANQVAIDPQAQAISAAARTDLQMLEDGWTDTIKAFKAAMSDVGLEQLIAQWRAAQGATALVASVPAGQSNEAAGPITGSLAALACH